MSRKQRKGYTQIPHVDDDAEDMFELDVDGYAPQLSGHDPLQLGSLSTENKAVNHNGFHDILGDRPVDELRHPSIDAEADHREPGPAPRFSFDDDQDEVDANGERKEDSFRSSINRVFEDKLTLAPNKFDIDYGDFYHRRIRVRTVLLVGLSGSGKSRLTNLLVRSAHESKFSSAPVTRGTIMAGQTIINDTVLQVVDTVGFGDPSLQPTTIIRQIEEKLMSMGTSIHFVVVVLKMDRLRARLTGDLNLLLDDLQSWGLQRAQVRLAVTYCDWFSDQVKQTFLNDVRNSNIHPYLKQAKTHLFAIPNPEDIDPMYRDIVRRNTNAAVQDLFNDLLKSPAKAFSVKASTIKVESSLRQCMNCFCRCFYSD